MLLQRRVFVALGTRKMPGSVCFRLFAKLAEIVIEKTTERGKQ
jgi:hypothetical protein